MTTDHSPPPDHELIDALPYGVIAVSADGSVLRANAPARKLLPGLASGTGRRCRELLCCNAPGGPCERGCLVARAAGSANPSPEVRVDTAGGLSPGALWITASPLSDGRGAILHLRAGWRGDRRRRSEELWHSEPQLSIRALGSTQVQAVADSLDSDWLSQRPGQILKYLICERARIVTVDEIAEAIWPDSGLNSVSNTRYVIHRLRTKVEPRRAAHEEPSFVVARGGGYALDRERVWIDADEFERAVEAGQAAMTSLEAAAAAEHFEHAITLYRGPFLADEPYAHWAIDERNRLANMAAYALRVLTACARERGDSPSALRHLRRLAEIEPLDSTVHREFIQTLIDEGLRSEAKRHYDKFTNRLRRELEEEPDFDMRSLLERARDRAQR